MEQFLNEQEARLLLLQEQITGFLDALNTEYIDDERLQFVYPHLGGALSPAIIARSLDIELLDRLGQVKESLTVIHTARRVLLQK